MNKVEIIILTKNNFNLLKNCVKSILNKCEFSNYKIVIVDTGSDSNNIQNLKDLRTSYPDKIKLVAYDSYHFDKINNDIVKNFLDEDTDHVLFCNNDIIFINDCLSEMMKVVSDNDNIGTVGAKLFYEDNSIQHYGILFKVDSYFNLIIGHNRLGEKNSFDIDENIPVIGNTAALQLVSRKNLINFNFFPETYLDSLSDVEFNLTCLLHDKKNIVCGKALAYHLESQTRKTNGSILSTDYITLQNFTTKNWDKLKKIL